MYQVMFVIDASSSMAGFFDKLQSALIDFLHNPPRTLKQYMEHCCPDHSRVFVCVSLSIASTC